MGNNDIGCFQSINFQMSAMQLNALVTHQKKVVIIHAFMKLKVLNHQVANILRVRSYKNLKRKI